MALLVLSASAHAGGESSEMPPSILYHAGGLTHLMEDIQAKTITQSVWDKFIMGDQTNFDLPPSRRGLYGANEFSQTNQYAAAVIGRGDRPWVMRIHLKAECLNPDRIDQALFRLDDDSRFAQWARSENLAANPIFNDCTYQSDPERHPGMRTWEQKSYHEHDASPEEQLRSARCDEVIIRYFEANKISVVEDQVFPNSWYVRDRDCIDVIDGTADDLFVDLAAGKTSTYGAEENNGEWGDYAVIIQVLSETTVLKNRTGGPQDLKSWIRKIQKDEIPSFDPKDFISDDISTIELQLSRTALRCAGRNQIEQFQHVLSAEADSLLAKNPAIDVCQALPKDSRDQENCFQAIDNKNMEGVSRLYKKLGIICTQG